MGSRVEVATLLYQSASGPLRGGNDVEVLVDADGNYPAWLSAIAAARRTIHLEMYIVHNDVIGRRFRDALVERAKAGIEVRVLYDWFGALRPSSFRFWAPLAAAGGLVRVVNAPRPETLLGLFSRDHRKLLTVDGEVAFISGLCIGDDWVGDAGLGLPPWRDTGVQFRGPAVADAERAFASSWAAWGPALSETPRPGSGEGTRQGKVDLRVISTSPDRPTLYRLELALMSVAQQRIWLTDAYFMGTSTYIESLSDAAIRGVDVRLLLPNNSDVAWVGNASRTLYRRLLESGVRIFEWNGSMIHAKTAVADGRFVRIGSTNLNLSSWVGNWELDVAIEDDTIGRQMEGLYERDLQNATEVIITDRQRIRLRERPATERPARPRPRGSLSRRMGGSANRVMRDMTLAGSVLGSAVRGYRPVGPAEAAALAFFGAAAALLSSVVFWWPRVLAWPVAVIGMWVALSLFFRAWRAHRDAGNGKQE
jgi:cardiolipin synthase